MRAKAKVYYLCRIVLLVFAHNLLFRASYRLADVYCSSPSKNLFGLAFLMLTQSHLLLLENWYFIGNIF
jgi:hypothetical protein